MKPPFLFAAFAVVAITLAGCVHTELPDVARAVTPSLDGNVANSGLLSLDEGGGIITANARERYNGLIALYGAAFVPPLTVNAGLTTATNGWRMDREHLADFAMMNRWHKNNRPPVPVRTSAPQ
jgi:hypothetical protein